MDEDVAGRRGKNKAYSHMARVPINRSMRDNHIVPRGGVFPQVVGMRMAVRVSIIKLES